MTVRNTFKKVCLSYAFTVDKKAQAFSYTVRQKQNPGEKSSRVLSLIKIGSMMIFSLS
jgi:hypothetical protein